jgi:hypothetical protein
MSFRHSSLLAIVALAIAAGSSAMYRDLNAQVSTSAPIIKTSCGDRVCQSGEFLSCPFDCIWFLRPTVTSSSSRSSASSVKPAEMEQGKCGNRICDVGETNQSCPFDCATITPPIPHIKCNYNRLCEATLGENPATCAFDCSVQPSSRSASSRMSSSSRRSFIPPTPPLRSSSSVRSSSMHSSSLSTATSSAAYGCISITAEGYDATGRKLSTVPEFTFLYYNPILQTQLSTANNTAGIAMFANVPPGPIIVRQIPQWGWRGEMVQPMNGRVTVTAGTACASVTFTNAQTNTSSVRTSQGSTSRVSSRRSSSASDSYLYCGSYKCNRNRMDSGCPTCTGDCGDGVCSAGETGARAGGPFFYYCPADCPVPPANPVGNDHAGKEINQTCPTSDPYYTCSDSDCSGKKSIQIYRTGTMNIVQKTDPNTVYGGTDYCVSARILREYYCQQDVGTSRIMPIPPYTDTICPYGCSQGACRTAVPSLAWWDVLGHIGHALLGSVLPAF